MHGFPVVERCAAVKLTVLGYATDLCPNHENDLATKPVTSGDSSAG
jgi:hypothetical protein